MEWLFKLALLFKKSDIFAIGSVVRHYSRRLKYIFPALASTCIAKDATLLVCGCDDWCIYCTHVGPVPDSSFSCRSGGLLSMLGAVPHPAVDDCLCAAPGLDSTIAQHPNSYILLVR